MIIVVEYDVAHLKGRFFPLNGAVGPGTQAIEDEIRAKFDSHELNPQTTNYKYR